MEPPSSYTSPNNNNKRLKTLDPHHPQSEPDNSIPIDEEDNSIPIEEEQSEEDEPPAEDCCAICQSKSGSHSGVSTGYIDCCDHHFCFLCIMEWAKVESRCPICKRRFSAIRRPPKPPVFAYERVIQVPVRDQVHYQSGNSTVGPPNPYSEAKCCMCLGTSDESLLLLCDLCDSAAHTYCVGLGVTVPEGDWFCEDCTILKDERFISDTNSGVETSFHAVSVFDIVRDPCPPTTDRSQRASLGTSMIKNNTQPSSASVEIVRRHQTNPNARALQQCLNLHDRIRVLRDNWNGFQSGVLHFSSSPGDDNNLKHVTVAYEGERYSASRFNQQPEVHCSSSVKIDYQIKKAWKMMDKAKSIKKCLERSSTIPQASKSSIRKVDAFKSGDSNNVRDTRSGNRYHDSLGKEYNKRECSVSGKQKCRRQITKDFTNCCESSVKGHSLRDRELKSSKGVQTLSFPFNAGPRSEKLHDGKSVDGRDCLKPSGSSEPDVFNIDHVKGINYISSFHSMVTKERRKLDTTHVDSRQYSDAKSEIQSLVKLNLKLQTKREKLEVDDFKEVARLATHSILSSCGLEDPRPGSYSIPGPICSHPKEIWQHQKSSLMPDSCRECFYIYL